MQFANGTTAAAVKIVESGTHEYLTAQPVDALIQRLYKDSEIVLPRLDRDNISFDHFDSYIGPYIEDAPRDQTGHQKFNDLSRGNLFAFEIAFVGNKRCFSLRPNRTTDTRPLAYVGDTSLIVYIPQRNHAVDFIQSQFEQSIASIESYLRLQFETLKGFPMTFYRTLEAVVAGRIDHFKRTSDVISALPYKPKSPPSPATPTLPVRTPAPKPAEEPPRMVTGNHFLLTGAGFSKNWGGLLASEVFNDLLSAPDIDQATRQMLFRANEPFGGGFENVLGKLQAATDPENVKRREALTSALAGIFNEMGLGYMARQFEFSAQPDTRYALTPFLRRFQTIFTTNQDTLIEQKYIPFSGLERRAHLPGLKYINPGSATGSAHDSIAVMEPNPTDFALSPTMQPYIKLHGSVNWVESRAGQRILIMGGQKTTIIKRFPLLSWYQEEFRKALLLPGARLMVMGYSFSDEHLNDAILAAVKESNLKLFIVDPGGVGIIDKRDKTAAVPIPKSEDQELLEGRIIGVSTRPISTSFNDDVVENNRLQKFFAPN